MFLKLATIGMLRIVLLAIFILGGCANPNRLCHTFDDCPHLLYAWQRNPSEETLTEYNAKGMPYLLAATQPYYPKHAWDNAISGEVEMTFDVDAEGKATNIKIKRSMPKGIFDQAAVEALKRSKYTRTEKGAAGFTRKFTWSIEENK